jgi:hypothetical protein
MKVTFPIQIRRPFEMTNRRSPNIYSARFGSWPTAGSSVDPVTQPPTRIPIDTDAVATIRFGSAPMLVTHDGYEAQYRLATCVATLQINAVSRVLAPSETLFLNLQMVGTLQGGDTVLANAYPDMAVPYARENDGTVNLVNHRIVFPTLTAPVGTVLNTIGMRLVLFKEFGPGERPDPLVPFYFEYSIVGAAVVADPIAGPIVDLHY